MSKALKTQQVKMKIYKLYTQIKDVFWVLVGF